MSHRLVRLRSAEDINHRLMSNTVGDQQVVRELFPRIVLMAADQEKCAEGLFLCVVNPIMRLRMKGGYFYTHFDLTMMMVPVWIGCLTDDQELIKEATSFWHPEH